MDKKTIAGNFSRHARSYDQYADAQRMAGIELLNWLKRGRYSSILELGCGTGNYTLLLRDKFRGAEIKAVDISDKMIEVAAKKIQDENIEFIVSDAENLNLAREFDLITSNACFHWFRDLEKALLRYKGLLRKDGVILFSLFGPLTFRELNSSLGSVSKGTSIAATGFISAEEAKRILYDNFKDAEIKEMDYEESFVSLIDLLNKIKYTGVRGNGPGNKFSFNRGALKKIEKAYLNKFRRIKATYQIFFCRGRME